MIRSQFQFQFQSQTRELCKVLYALAFQRGWASVYQVLAGKPLANGALTLPLTREYIYRDSL